MHSTKVKYVASNPYTDNQYLALFYLFFTTQCKSSDAHWFEKGHATLENLTTLKNSYKFEKAHSSIKGFFLR